MEVVHSRSAAGFVTGLLSDLEVKTCWQLAEQAGHGRPDAMQRLLYRAKWDADAVRDDVRKVVVDRFGDCRARKSGFGYTAGEYWLIRPPRIGRRWTRAVVRSTTSGGRLGGCWSNEPFSS